MTRFRLITGLLRIASYEQLAQLQRASQMEGITLALAAATEVSPP
jgi:hypothetical protein